MTDPIRVLIVDDHAMLRAGFRTILDVQPDIQVVGEAATGAEAIERAAELHPDVITMDVQMPDMDGIAATRAIVADAGIPAAVVIVTTFDRDDYLFSALDAGASGFLLKNAGPEELLSAVRVLAAGDAMLAPEVTRRVLARFAGTAGGMPGAGAAGATPDAGAAGVTPAAGTPGAAPTSDASAAPRPIPATPLAVAEPLTEREAEVLRLMAEALSNAEIAEQLFIGEATVKTHVSRVLQKLGARDRVQAVVLAHRHALV